MNMLADRYARFIVHSMLRLEDGDRLTIHSNEETVEFAHKVAHEAADTTGVPVSLVYIEKGKVESVDEISPDFPARQAEGDVMLHLASFTSRPFDRDAEMDAVNLQNHRLLADPIFLDRRISIPYAVAYVPTAAWAEFVYGPGSTVDQLYLDLADFLSLDEGMDVTSTLERTLHHRATLLNGMDIERLQLKSPTMELECSLAKGARIGTTASRLSGGRFFYPTFPCEDLIFPIDFSKAEGHLHTTYPFRFFDSVIEDAEIEVKGGRITLFSCERSDYVEKYMNIDTRSASIGEIILCESLTQAASFHRAFGLPLLDRMRTSQVVFGGVTPEMVTITDENRLEEMGLNTGFARLEIPVGSRDLTVTANTRDGGVHTIFEDGVFCL